MVVDTHYYDLLEISPTATTVEIKKGFRRAALKYHPDKRPDDPEAERKFTQINEAYQCLIDETKRERYDKFGLEKAQQSAQAQDPKEIFTMIFGADGFVDYFGDVEMVTFLLSIMTEEGLEDLSPEEQEEKQKKMAEEHAKDVEAKCKNLAEKLIKMLDVTDIKEFEKEMKDKALDLAEYPGGAGLLQHLGYIYKQEAEQHMGKYFGVQGYIAEWKESGHNFKQVMSFVKTAAILQARADEIQRKDKEGHKAESIAMLETGLVQEGVNLIWKLGKMEIERVVRTVCELALKPQSELNQGMTKKQLKERAKVLHVMGRMFLEAGMVARTEEKLVLKAINSGAILGVEIIEFTATLDGEPAWGFNLREDGGLKNARKLQDKVIELKAGGKYEEKVKFRVAAENGGLKIVKSRKGVIMNSNTTIPITIHPEEAESEDGQEALVASTVLARKAKNEFTEVYSFCSSSKPFFRLELRFHITRADGAKTPRSPH